MVYHRDIERGALTKARYIPAAALAVCLAVSLFCFVYPLYVVRPFRSQGPRELAAALFVVRIRPILTLLAAAGALAALAVLWRRAHRWPRWAALAVALATLASAVFCRVNVYELMFHPLERASFSSAVRSRLDSAEMVIAVQAGGAARAYPIRVLSYHHVANDTLGGVPIAATY